MKDMETMHLAVLVGTMTDNRNRTASEVYSTFTKYGGRPWGNWFRFTWF